MAGTNSNPSQSFDAAVGSSGNPRAASSPLASGPGSGAIAGQEQMAERFFELLITGDRQAARSLIEQAFIAGCTAEWLFTELFWPTYQSIDRLHRADQMTVLSHHVATRLLRVIVDQTAARLATAPRNGQRVLCFCGPTDADELGAQLAVDLLESGGYSVEFAGGGIPGDEILGRVNESGADVLLMFASAPGDLPTMRQIIDQIREVAALPNLRIAVGAGVFNRAEGLAEEIGAHVWASNPMELVESLLQTPPPGLSAGERAAAAKPRRKTKAA